MSNDQAPKVEMYFSVDVESDGEAPGTSSMLSIGIVAIHPLEFTEVGTFYRTLKRLPGAQPSNKTMEWWDGFPKQWAETRAGASDPDDVMKSMHKWVIEMLKSVMSAELTTPPTAIFVADPAGFDFSMVYYYMHRFMGESIFGFSALDIQSYVMALMDSNFRTAGSEKNWRPEWKSSLLHTHNALEDAKKQADYFIKILKWRHSQKFVPKDA